MPTFSSTRHLADGTKMTLEQNNFSIVHIRLQKGTVVRAFSLSTEEAVVLGDMFDKHLILQPEAK